MEADDANNQAQGMEADDADNQRGQLAQRTPSPPLRRLSAPVSNQQETNVPNPAFKPKMSLLQHVEALGGVEDNRNAYHPPSRLSAPRFRRYTYTMPDRNLDALRTPSPQLRRLSAPVSNQQKTNVPNPAFKPKMSSQQKTNVPNPAFKPKMSSLQYVEALGGVEDNRNAYHPPRRLSAPRFRRYTMPDRNLDALRTPSPPLRRLSAPVSNQQETNVPNPAFKPKMSLLQYAEALGRVVKPENKYRPLRGISAPVGNQRFRRYTMPDRNLDAPRRIAKQEEDEPDTQRNIMPELEKVEDIAKQEEDEPDTQRNIMPELEKVEDMPPPEDVEDMPPLEDAEEHWVVVFGYPQDCANDVLKMFKMYGVVLKHVPGPRDANWVHIQYEDRSGALTALSKHGVQINGAVLVGVKLVDAMQHQDLNERFKRINQKMTLSDWVFGNPFSGDWARKVNQSTHGLRKRINQKPPSLSTEMTISDWVFGNPFSGDWARKVNRSTPGLRKWT